MTTADNVRAQKRFVKEAFGVDRVACVYGFSMGAQQAYHWAALFPDEVERVVVVCGSARTAVHNQVFLRSLLATLEAAPEHLGGGRFSTTPTKGLRAFARIYAGWAMSQDWYRANLHLTSTGAANLDDFLDHFWEPRFARRKAEDLYAQALTWIASDISANELYEGDLVRALQAIRARVLLMPGRTDLYFPVADNALELPFLERAELRPIPSIWGHLAGSPSPDRSDYSLPSRRCSLLARMNETGSTGARSICPAEVTRQTVFPTSSAIRSAPVLSMARPTGRPRAFPLASRKSVTTSSALPLG